MKNYLDKLGLSYLWSKIKATFIAKSDTTAVTSIGIDSTPTTNSSNLITSGGVKTALDTKLNTLDTQTAYTSIGSSTAIPSITTNSLGLVTGISTVAISIPDPSGKADKVTNATSGNFAALDANGNLTDSGHSHSDYLTLHLSLSNYVTLDGALNITGEKTFVGTKRIKFKQGSSSDKLGFTLYNTSSVESGNFEGDIANRAINLGIYALNSKPASDWLVGFKIQAQDSAGTTHKYGLRTPPRLGNGTYAEHYIPVVINGKEANNAGVLTLTASDVSALPSTTVIPSAPGTLNTNNTTGLTVNSSESLSGTINLHKVSKTGNYNHLLNTPTGRDFLDEINAYIETETDDGSSTFITDGTSNIQFNKDGLILRSTIGSAECSIQMYDEGIDISGDSIMLNGDDLTFNGENVALASDIPDVSDFISTSNTSGLIKNDGTIDTSNYVKTINNVSPDNSGNVTLPSTTITFRQW